MPHPSLFRRAVAVVVGLFATWQLIFLPAANLIEFVPRRGAAEVAGGALDFWSEVSGQEQSWSLFAPGFPPYTVAPAAEFQFADGTSDTALSPFEPRDKLNPPARPPLLDNRVFNIEAQLVYPVWFASPEAVASAPDRYRDLPDKALARRGAVRAWLALRLKEYRAAHPNGPDPVAVVLKHRYIPTPHPGAARGWTLPVEERPFARWFPETDAYEAFDAVQKRWVKP